MQRERKLLIVVDIIRGKTDTKHERRSYEEETF